MTPPMRVLSLPCLNQDVDLDCIDAELIWLGIPKNRKTGQRTSCKVCGLKFSTPIVLQQHLSTVHSRDNRRNHRNIDHWLQSCHIPLTYEEVVNLPFEEFEELGQRYNLTAEQLVLCKDIRRRGFNRISAARSRKKKKALIKSLKYDLNCLKNTRKELMQRQVLLLLGITKWESDILSAQNHILHKLGFDQTKWHLIEDPISGEIHLSMKENYQFILSKV